MKTVKRFDLSEIGSFEVTPQGFLKIPGFATRTGVFTYKDGDGNIRRELRHPDEVFDPESLSTLQNSPVTLDHPPVMVDPSNINKYIKGYCTDKVGVNRDLVEAELIVSHKDAIDAIKKGMRELSSGYAADLVEESGIYEGTRYDYRQTNIKYNHLALVDKGRAGPEVRLRLDSADAIMEKQKGDTMKMDRIKIGDQEVEMPRQAAMVVKDMMDRYDEMKSKTDMMGSEKEDGDGNETGLFKNQEEMMDMYKDMKAMHDSINGKVADSEEEDEDKMDMDVNQNSVGPNIPDSDMAKDGTSVGSKVGSSDTKGDMRAAGYDAEDDGVANSPAEELAMALEENKGLKDKLDAMSAKLDEYEDTSVKEDKMDSMDSKINKAVLARTSLLRKAEKILGSKSSDRFDSMTNHQIRCEAIKAVHNNIDLKGKSKVYVEARFDSVVDSIGKADSFRVGTKMKKNRMDKYESVNSKDARERYLEESRNAWKGSLSAEKK